MAADFPPNLDDGELWLPSEIYTDVGVCRRRHHNRQSPVALRPGYPSDLGYIEDLAQQLAAFGLLERNRFPAALKPNPNLSSHPERLVSGRQVVRFGPAEPEGGAGLVYDGYRPSAVGRVGSGFGTGAYFPGPMPPLQFNPGKPIQVDGSGQGRARVLQRPTQNRFIPTVRLSGSGRECGGTGVFLPRVAVNSDVGKKPNMKGEEQQRQQPTRNAALRKQGEPLQRPPEMRLPQDWTY